MEQVVENTMETKEKTKKSTAIFYSFGEVGNQLSWYMINTYLMIFYTDIVGMAAGAISIIMLIARLWQAINGPVWGMVQDRTYTKWGKFRPYLLFLPVFLGIFNVMTFTVFPLTGLLKIVVCLVCYMAVGTLYTAISNAYSALVNVIAKDSQVRMNYSSARSVGSSIISMILSAVAMPMILFFGKSDTANATGFFWTTVVCSIAMVPMLMLCGWKCKEIIEVKSYGHAIKQKQSIGESIKLLGQNKMLLIVVLTTFFGAMATMLRMSMLAYYIIYVVGSYTMVAPIMTIMTFMQLAGSMALPIGTKLFGKKMYMLYNNFAQIICMVLLFILPVSNTFILIGLSAVIGFTNASANITFGMMSDCIEYGDWKFKVRNEGLSVSTLMLSVNAATALTGSIGILLLSATGYVANAAQSASTVTGIDVLVNVIPAALTILSVIVLSFYKIDNKMMNTITNDLEARNKLDIKGDL